MHVSTMADDYYRFVERAHILRGENTGKVYRLGDRVAVQVVKVDMERRQVDLGLVEILERGPGVRTEPRSAAEQCRAAAPAAGGARAGPVRRSGQGRKKKDKADKSVKRKQRPGRRERALRKGR